MTTTKTQPTPAPKPDAQPVQAATHTPGPWRMSGSETAVYRALPNGGSDLNEPICWSTDTGKPSAEVSANCRLIASAPALLAALERIAAGDTMAGREMWSLADVIQEHYRIARAALQLAMGGAK